MKITIIIAGILVALAGCSSSDSLSRQDRNIAYESYITSSKLQTVKEIQRFKMRKWKSLTDEFLIISNNTSSRNYLVKMKGKCYDLEHANNLITHQQMAGRLSSGFDALSVSSSPNKKCYIDSIYKISKSDSKNIREIGKSLS